MGGYRTFAPGEVLTSANVMSYLMSQATMVFTTSAARDSAITSPTEGMVAALTTPETLTIYDGSGWVTWGNYTSWTTYTPTWLSNAAAPGLGNGSADGRYCRFGKQVTFYATIGIGSTSTPGTGVWSVSLPVTARTATEQNVSGRLVDVSASKSWYGYATLQTGTRAAPVVYQAEATGAMTPISPGAPATLANGDSIMVWGTYEAA